MKKGMIFFCLSIGFSAIQAQTLNSILKKADKVLKNTQAITQPGTGNVSNVEIVNGLKEALTLGSKNAAETLHKPNGFLGNALIKIAMPPEAKKVETTLRSFGFNTLCDKLIVSINQAAEDASGKAAPIFANAITSMSITDALGILRGNNHAATEFLQRATTASLTAAFRPIIDQSLGKVNATKYWGEVFSTYNKLPITRNKVNTDLTGYVTERALYGLFISVGNEEENIRKNPSARVSTLLQKVFGSK
jgi:hypothetical protein